MNGPLQFMAGIAPNLIGSFLVPFAAYWLYTHPRFFNGQLLRFYFFSDNRIVCLTGFVLALVNEYIQLIPVFGRTFDYYDILFSALGLLLAFYSFCFVKKRESVVLKLFSALRLYWKLMFWMIPFLVPIFG